jgi:hypothetical protein
MANRFFGWLRNGPRAKYFIAPGNTHAMTVSQELPTNQKLEA